MKKNYLLNFLLLSLILTSYDFFAQAVSAADFIKGGKNDAVKIISSYLLPVEKAMCFNGANNNMYLFKKEGVSEVKFGFSLNLTTSFVAPSDYTYDVSKLNLEKFEAQDPNKTIAQTLAGNESTIVLQTKQKNPITNKPILTLNSPKGTDNTYILFPVLNLFVEKDGNMIDLKVLPPVQIKSKSLEIFNIGANFQHNIETSIKSIEDFWCDFYIATGYNYNKITYFLDIKPDETNITFSPNGDNGPYDNQELQIHTQSIPVSLRTVKQYKNFSFALGAGYNFTDSKVKMVGKYPIYGQDPSNNSQVIVDDIEDPFKYTRQFDKAFVDAGVNYRLNNFSTGLKYTHSEYKNIDLTLAYLF